MAGTRSHLRKVNNHNLRTVRSQFLAELSGSLGDLGTLLPILLSLAVNGSISLPSTLLFTGVANIYTGLVFGIPLPVQPMKALAASAIDGNFHPGTLTAGGLFVGAIVGILAITGILERVARFVPVPVVKGIQAGAGLTLMISAGKRLFTWTDWTRPNWADNYLWAIAAALVLLACARHPRAPYALFAVVLGFVFAAILLGTGHGYAGDRINAEIPTIVPIGKDWETGLMAGLGQLPLTLLNSVIAVTHLAGDLMPDHPNPSNTHISLSIAAMNLVGNWFGSMPACHGSGGLAAQWRFGARSGSSVVMLGSIKIILAIVVLVLGATGYSSGVGDFISNFPHSILGIMLIAAGIELAGVGLSVNEGARDLWEVAERQQAGDPPHSVSAPRKLSDEERKDRWSVTLVTVAGKLAFRNDLVGFLAGMVWHYGLVLERHAQESRGWAFWRRETERAADSAETEPLLTES